MSSKVRHAQRAIATVGKRPAAENAGLVVDDPVSVGLDRSIKIDMAKLPTPQNVYDANYAWIEHRPGAVSLFFAKRDRDNPSDLRSRLELRYPPENLVGHFWRNSRDFHQKMGDYAAKWPVDQEREKIDPRSMKTTREHSQWANFEAMAHAGTEAVIDFYLLPPSGIARYARGEGSSGLKILPIVRVETTIFELMRLLDSTEPIVREVEAYLPGRPEIREAEISDTPALQGERS